jgi:hypothetical protein
MEFVNCCGDCKKNNEECFQFTGCADDALLCSCGHKKHKHIHNVGPGNEFHLLILTS